MLALLRGESMPRTLGRIFPFLRWPRPTASSLRADVVAGISVSLVAIPQSLAYAQLAGVPAYYGLYAAFIPTIVGVLFGSSAQLATGPVAMTSLLTAASVAALQPHGLDQFYAYVTMLALLSGVFQLAFGLARAGALMSLISHPVLIGFINAAALIIALTQLPALMGIPTRQTDHLLLDSWNVLTRMDLLHEISLALGVAAIVLLLAFKRFAPRLPGVLITVALLTWVSYMVGFGDRGGRIVGAVPTGLPGFGVPDLGWESIKALLPAGLVVAVISFMEAMSSCKVIAIKTRTPWNENQELIGQGLAKIAAAFCQSMPVSGSFSRSALNLSTGARTGVSSLVAAAAVVFALLYFTPYLYHLPKPVLAAIIMLAVLNLMDLAAMRRAWLASREDGVAAIVTFVVTLAFAPNIQIGILVGIVVSLATYVYGRMRPTVAVAGASPQRPLRDAERFDIPGLDPRIGAVRFDASLYFANASYFEDAVLRLERENPGLQYILVAAQSINNLDASGAEMLRNLSVRLRQAGVTLVMGGVKRQVLDVMERTGLVADMGEANVFTSERQAIERLHARVAEGSIR